LPASAARRRAAGGIGESGSRTVTAMRHFTTLRTPTLRQERRAAVSGGFR